MTIYLSTHTGLENDTILDNADAGNINKSQGQIGEVADFDNENSSRFFASGPSSANAPLGATRFGAVTLQTNVTNNIGQFAIDGLNVNRAFIRSNTGTWNAWQELYHTGNTGNVEYADGNPSGDVTRFAIAQATIRNSRAGTATSSHLEFYNDNGSVGNIQTAGSATAYNTSSDPRLKDFKDLPSDSDINDEFSKLFDCFRVFNWNADLDGDLVWGFDAHECIDKNTSIGSEGEGPRNLALGDVYDTTPAVFEDQEVQLVYKSGDKKGQPRFDSEGDAIMETVSVEVTAEIEHKVSPAGVDQSKAVPILLAKLEQLERRLTAAGL